MSAVMSAHARSQQLGQTALVCCLQGTVQLSAQRCGQWRRHSVAHLPVSRMDIATEKVVVWEPLRATLPRVGGAGGRAGRQRH